MPAPEDAFQARRGCKAMRGRQLRGRMLILGSGLLLAGAAIGCADSVRQKSPGVKELMAQRDSGRIEWRALAHEEAD